MGALPLGASNIINVGNTSVAEGDGWSYANGVFTITGNGEYIITGNTSENRIVVQSGVKATINLDSVKVDMSGKENLSALDVSGADVTLVLSGENELLSSGTAAGLRAPDGSTLTITSISGDGSEDGSLLAANAGATHGSGAGIGGSGGTTGNGESGGNITINGGTITAKGYYDGETDFTNPGAGIGGGGWNGDPDSDSSGGSGGTITINGGKVTAVGGSSQTSGSEGAAGIGGGSGELYTDHNDPDVNAGGSGGVITINGGTIVTGSQINGAGIGGGYRGDSGEIVINGGHITAQGGAKGTGIGAGMRGDNNEITINGGVVIAYGGELTTTVAAGDYRPSAIGGSTGEPGNITITGGTIVAIGSEGYIAIGSTNPNDAEIPGNIVITGGTIITNGNIGLYKGNVMPVDLSQGQPVILVLSRDAIGITSNQRNPDEGILVGYLASWDFDNVQPNANFYGDVLVDIDRKEVTLFEDVTIKDDAVLSFPSRWTLNAGNYLTLTKGSVLGFDLHDIDAGSPDVSLRITGSPKGLIGAGSIYIWNFKGDEGYYILAQADDAEYLTNPEKFYLEGKLTDNKRSTTKGDMLFATRIWKAADSNYLEGSEGQLVLQAADATKNTKVTWKSKTGSGMWDTSGEYWAGNVDGIPVNTFLNGDDVVFDTAAQVTVGPHDVTANTIEIKSETTFTGHNVNATTGFKINPGAKLSVGSQNADGSISGDVTNNGNLTFNTNIKDVAFNDEISGSGTLTKKGARNLTLRGYNSYSGATDVEEGSLTLPEHSVLSASDVTVRDAATFNLYGAAGKDVTVNPGGLMNVYRGGEIGGDLYARGGTLNFYVPGGETPAQIGTMLSVAGEADITDSTVNVGINGANSPLKGGDEIVLIDADSRVGAPVNEKGKATGMQGVTLQYEFDILTRNGQLLAVLPLADDDDPGTPDPKDPDPEDPPVERETPEDKPDDSGRGATAPAPAKAKVDPRTKTLTEGYVSGLALVHQGGDLIGAALPEEQEVNYRVFADFGGADLHYQSGLHFDLKSYTGIAGISKGFETNNRHLVQGGVFIEHGNGKYKTSSDFPGYGAVRGDGNADYVGGGLLGRVDFVEKDNRHFYVNGSLRGGRLRNHYNSGLEDATGAFARFAAATAYYGAHFGIGHIYREGNNKLDVSSKYFYTHVNSDSLRLSTGDPIDFGAIDSHRFQLGMKVIHNYNTSMASYAALIYDRTWDGEATATTNGYAIESSSLRGETGIGELGLVWNPTDPFSVDIGVQGYRGGAREGLSGTLKLKYEF
ncbi:MAG: hypothetical protein LBQ97_06875 [Fusobacteriaceae bacterium]|nr:hypothetical protein [Fusobacteriaceae bacterium]